MPNYKKLYFKLFGAVEDAMEILEKKLRDCEKIYVEENDSAILSFSEGKKALEENENLDKKDH